MTRLIALTLACLIVLPATAANTIYVNNMAGDDRHRGMSPQVDSAGGPCRTIARALQLAQKGDVVELVDTGQPYRESVSIQGGHNSGRPSYPFTIRGNGVILDGSRPVPNGGWQHWRDDVFFFQPSHGRFQQLFLDGVPAQRVAAEQGGPLPELKPLQWCLWQGGIFFRVEEGRLPQQYSLAYAALRVGLTMYQVNDVIVEDLIVQGFQLDGANAHDSAFGCQLIGVTALGNGRSGVSIGGSSRVTLHQCVLGDNGHVQLRTEGHAHAHAIGCELIDNTGPATRRDGGELIVEQPAVEPEAEASVE